LTLRENAKDDVINGHFIPAHTTFVIPIQAYCISEIYFGPTAKKFDPDRWQSLPPDAQLAFLTFLMGPRSCIGKAFAITELKTLIAILVLNFNFTLAYPDRPVVRKQGITVRPKDGMFLKMEIV